MTENEYTHLLTLYYSGDYCMCMTFQEFVTMYAGKFLKGEKMNERS